MRLTLPKDLEAFVRGKVETGRYRDPAEAVADGVRLLKERDDAEFRALQALLKTRIKESEGGDTLAFNSKLRAQIRKRGLARLRAIQKRRS